MSAVDNNARLYRRQGGERLLAFQETFLPSFLLPACLYGAVRLPSPVSHQALFSRDRRSQGICRPGDRRQVGPDQSENLLVESSAVQWITLGHH